MVHDWSRAGYPLNSTLSNPPVQYGAMGDFLRVLTPGAYMGGVGLQDCFPHLLVAAARRRFLGVRRPITGRLGVYLFLPFGLGPSPGWTDGRATAILSVERSYVPAMHFVDSADGIRLVDAPGQHDALAVGMSGLMSLLGRKGARYHAKEGKRWRPTRLTPWLGFEVDTHNDVVRVEEREVEKGLRLREGILEPLSGATTQARDLLATASHLNFLQWVAPGGFCHLRSG